MTEVKRVGIKGTEDIRCPKCGGTADWDGSDFREWIDAETCIWDMEWFCEQCGHRWVLGMEFTLSVIIDDTDPGVTVEYEVVA